MFKGSMVALVTPMHPSGAVDKTSLHKLLDMHLAAGTDAIVVAGTTGESATLEPEEQFDLLKTALERVRQTVSVIIGTGCNSTQKTISLTQKAKELGAQAALVVTPYYNKPTQEGLYAHYSAVAASTDIPIILYNVPGRTSCDLQPETVGRLSRIANIVGIKEAVTDLNRLKALQAVCQKGFCFYSGDDATARDFMLLGGHGVISVTANVSPVGMKALCEAALSKQKGQAATIDAKMALLHQALFVESNPIPVKWALAKMGLIEPGIRLPLTWLSSRYQEKVQLALTEAGVL